MSAARTTKSNKASARSRTAAALIARPMVGNAEATAGGPQCTLRMQCNLSDLSISDRRAIFSALLRDEAVVTAARFTEESINLHQAVEAACQWEGY